jgi:hypothetical protein
MTDFNYQKAYCVLAVPAFNDLNQEQRGSFRALLPMVGDLSQGRDLSILLNDSIRVILDALDCNELATLSRAVYFVGHWYPGFLPELFDNDKGESWKVANCCDQVLRERLKPPYNIQIHEGVLRVTFSNRDCWIWEEFGLATEKNIEIFKTCDLPFGENTLHHSAAQLRKSIGDMWPEVEDSPNNELYLEYLKAQNIAERQKIQRDFEAKLKRLDMDIADAHEEKAFLLYCNEVGIPTDNVIFYAHTKTFCFGWRGPYTGKEREDIWRNSRKFNSDDRFKIDFKLNAKR